MSILTQLFSAQDLNNLSPENLHSLREAIKSHFNASIDVSVNTTLQTRYIPPTTLPPWIRPEILERISRRAGHLFRDLKGSASQPSLTDTGQLDLSQPLFPQIFQQESFDELTDHERKIIEMALSCDIVHINHYNHLETIREVAYEKYRALTNGQNPGGPDTYYSPFYPDSPLHEILNPPAQ